MRLPARRTATSVLCATFLLGLTGPAAMAADGDAPRERAGAAAHAPAAEAGRPDDQAALLGSMGDYLRPVTQLLGAVTKRGDGRLTAQETDRLSVAIEEALAKAEAARAASLAADPDDDEDWNGDDEDQDEDQDDDGRDDEDDDGGRDHGDRDDEDDDGGQDHGGRDDEDDDGGRGGDGDGGADWDGFAPGDWDDWVNGPAGTARDAAAPVTTLPARPDLAPDDPAADDAARAQLRSDVDTLAEAGLSGTIRQIGSAAASVVQSLTNALAAILSGGSLSGLADDDRA
ncbi:hypothetical protein [Streptomyces fumanus]|uniref:hypothetical protein n=1 Tax=Streptomyces fumanus TaxID=67302 RepID=UPI0033D938C3